MYPNHNLPPGHGFHDNCPKCGAPMTMFVGVWHSILPPPKHYTCACFPSAKTTTSDHSTTKFPQ